jgi:hypothetical protein
VRTCEILPPFSTHVRSSRRRASSLHCGGGAAGGYPPSSPALPPLAGIHPLVPCRHRHQASSLQSRTAAAAGHPPSSFAPRHCGILLPFRVVGCRRQRRIIPVDLVTGAAVAASYSSKPRRPSPPPTGQSSLPFAGHATAFCRVAYLRSSARRWPDFVPLDTRVLVHVRHGPLELPMPLASAATHGREPQGMYNP